MNDNLDHSLGFSHGMICVLTISKSFSAIVVHFSCDLLMDCLREQQNAREQNIKYQCRLQLQSIPIN